MLRHLNTLGHIALLLLLVGCGAQPATDTASDSAASDGPAADVSPPEAQEPAPASADAGGDACASLTVEEIAGIFGADPATVNQAVGQAASFSDGRNNDCDTTVVHEGIETTVNMLIFTKNENHADDAWARRIEDALANGEKMGSQTYVYEPFTGAGIEGAISDIHGGKYVRIRSLQWQAEEKNFYRLTVSATLADDGNPDDIPVPSPELFTQLVEASAG